ncbi:MAG: hypothetical protein IKH76_10720 [Clostridiales bacterium]|nr:hypothetical protein [Clostridiales bacterium]
MLSKTNNDLLDSTYQDNLKKIPSIFRLTKLSIGIGAFIILAVVIAITIRISVMKRYDVGIFNGIENMATAMIYVTFGAMICIIVVAWFLFSLHLERKAFKDASDYAVQHERWEEERIREAYLQTKTQHTRDEFQPAPAVQADPNARICKKCGFPIMDMESRCANCGERYVSEES